MKTAFASQRFGVQIHQGYHINSSSHLESNTDLQHHIEKRYTYAIDNDINDHRQLEHNLNCLGQNHYQAQALNFQLSF
ncbi:hypothetical protein OUZ56_025417 [Daphnia magna]|uniref:Uncharacterized protein n=1 Tax=Daphnia magna TaxID=35525 RepID=A0ABQ9ZJT0_9CRUS|nr:hypothetical protein OUZ56_025417 [Daphnia magna]